MKTIAQGLCWLKKSLSVSYVHYSYILFHVLQNILLRLIAITVNYIGVN